MTTLCDYCGHSTTHYDHTACTPEAEAARDTDHGDPGPDLPEQVAGWTVPDTTNEENERMSQQQNRRALRWSVPVDDQWHPIGGGQVLHVDARSNGTVPMTGPEATAAMKPEDVPAELVEKAARAKYDADPYRRPDGSPWPWEELDLADIQEIRTETRHALAAVLPEIQAQALRDAADETERYAKDTYWRDDSPFHLQSRISAEMHAERLRARAARLTETKGADRG